MTIAFDDVTAASFTTEDPITLLHTPIGTPRAIVAALTRQSSSGDMAVDPATYGGVNMTRVQTAQDAAGEAGRVWLYFLGTGIPTGNQTFSLDVNATAGTKRLQIASFTAAGDCTVVASNILEGDAANPSIGLDSGADVAQRVAVLFAGGNDPAGYAPAAGNTEIEEFDIGNQQAIFIRQTTPASGNVAIGWTSASDDVAMAALAFKEAGGAAPASLLVPGGRSFRGLIVR